MLSAWGLADRTWLEANADWAAAFTASYATRLPPPLAELDQILAERVYEHVSRSARTDLGGECPSGQSVMVTADAPADGPVQLGSVAGLLPAASKNEPFVIRQALALVV